MQPFSGEKNSFSNGNSAVEDSRWTAEKLTATGVKTVASVKIIPSGDQNVTKEEIADKPGLLSGSTFSTFEQ